MPTDTLTCWSCGHENPGGAKFCANCGKPQRATCPECGAQLPEGAKFCASCGIPITGGAKAQPQAGPVLTAEARKVITAVFADLVGSTGLTERLDPEEAREVVGKFYSVVQHAVERFDGTVANLLGDAVLAVFGLPASHEDDPERAVRAALAMRDAMPVLNDHLEAEHGVRLDIRVGINTGEVVAASGSTFDHDFLVADAVTTAARLQQTVSPGAVVVGERTHRLTRDVVEYRTLPPLEVKGKATPLQVWEAIAPVSRRPDVRRIVAPLIGRHGELGLLRSFFQRCRDESLVHLITVIGQPGVGKSRLLREFLAEVRDTDPPPLVLHGRSVAFGGQIGYHALIDILRGQAGLLDTDTPDVVREKLASWLRERLPGHEAILDGLLLTFGADVKTQVDPGQLRRQLFEAWQSLLAALAAERPVIIAFEDVHWADDGLLDLIEWICESVEAAPLFLVCLARPDLLERRAAWASGARNGTRIDLKPLRPQESEQLVASLSSQGVAAEIRQVIASRAEGNPFFAEELVRMLMEGSGPGAAIPETVQAVLTARIDRLPQDERRVLQAAAVIGRSFWPSAVAPLAGLSEAEAARAIEGLIRKEMINPRPQSTIAGQREYAFRHILTRDVAYGMLPKSQRQRAHAEAARWLESQMEERVEEVIEILAEHLRVAGDDARAAAYLQRAANKARRQYANADAIRLFDQAEEAARKASLPPREMVPVHQGRGDVHQLMGNYAAALADFDRGLAAARAASDPPLEAVLESRVGLIHHRQMKLEEAQPHFARAAALARELGDRLMLGLSLVDLANVAWDQGRLSPDDPTITEAIALLREAGDPSSLARGLNLMCMARFSAANAPGALAAAEEALAASRQAGDKSREATSLSYLSVVNVFLGARYRDGVRYGGEAIALAEEIGDRRRIAFATNFIGRAKIALGQWGEAIRLLEESLAMSRAFAIVHLPWSLFYLGILYWELGATDRANAILGAGSEIETHHQSWREAVLLSQLHLARLNRGAGAINGALDELVRIPHGVFIPDDAEAILPVGEGLLEVGRIEDLRTYMAARRPGIEVFKAPPHLAALDILDAQLAMHEGRRDDAIAHLDRAWRSSQASEDVTRPRRILELRLQLLGLPDDRSALRSLLERLAATLPDDLRGTFLASPRAAVLRE